MSYHRGDVGLMMRKTPLAPGILFYSIRSAVPFTDIGSVQESDVGVYCF